jgi:hypothetical protein
MYVPYVCGSHRTASMPPPHASPSLPSLGDELPPHRDPLVFAGPEGPGTARAPGHGVGKGRAQVA